MFLDDKRVFIAPVEVDPVTQQLIQARELIADEKNWCVGDLEDASGRMCARGAIFKVTHGNAHDWNGMDSEAHHRLMRVSFNRYEDDIAGVNNNHGHAAVMQIFDEAISHGY